MSDLNILLVREMDITNAFRPVPVSEIPDSEVKDFLSGLTRKEVSVHSEPLKSGDNDMQQEITPKRFDPNTAGRDMLIDLGLGDFVINNIMKYRKAGGRFSTAEDFSKIYGLNSAEYESLKPYISISEQGGAEDRVAHNAKAKVVEDLFTIEVNSAIPRRIYENQRHWKGSL